MAVCVVDDTLEMREARSNSGIAFHCIDTTPGERGTDVFCKSRLFGEGDPDPRGVKTVVQGKSVFTRAEELIGPPPEVLSGGRGDTGRSRGISIDRGDALRTGTASEGESR